MFRACPLSRFFGQNINFTLTLARYAVGRAAHNGVRRVWSARAMKTFVLIVALWGNSYAVDHDLTLADCTAVRARLISGLASPEGVQIKAPESAVRCEESEK